MASPSITVFIPTYNRLPLLKRAVASVLDQGDLVRLHILDNASTDGTSEWLTATSKNEPRIHLTLRESNLGAHTNYLEGFQAVQTPFLVPLADDDQLAPGFLESALEAITLEKDVACVICHTEIRRGGKLLGYSPAKIISGRREPAEHLKQWGKQGHYVSWSSILWRSEKLLTHINAGEMERFGLPSDVYIQFLVFSESPVYLLDRVGSVFNQHDAQASASIGPDLITTYALMLKSMDSILSKRALLTKEQQKHFLTCVCSRINEVIESACEKKFERCSGEHIEQWTVDYMQGLAPHATIDTFPLLPLFAKYRNMQHAFREMQDLSTQLDESLKRTTAQLKSAHTAANQAEECVNRMKRSLSWRLTCPLRKLDGLFSLPLRKRHQ